MTIDEKCFIRKGVLMLTTKDELLKVIKKHKPELQSKYPIKKIGLFGSWIRNEQKKSSDIDALIELSEPISIFQFIDIQEYLEKILGKKVDLVTTNALKPAIKKSILSEVQFL
ncbi:MAG: nucleotidyltransferase family protein [Candidatus Cloacimonadaceae bacterium]